MMVANMHNMCEEDGRKRHNHNELGPSNTERCTANGMHVACAWCSADCGASISSIWCSCKKVEKLVRLTKRYVQALIRPQLACSRVYPGSTARWPPGMIRLRPPGWQTCSQPVS